jgi:gliding motility-associated-like protein
VVVKRIRERFPNAEVFIFNRWGSEVYHKEGYDNSFDGKDLPDDTYYYVVDFKSPGQEIRKGYLTIMR